MEADWVKLRMDCSWKRLQAVVFRNVPATPQTLSVALITAAGEVVFASSQGLTCNPAWTLPSIPLQCFPLTINLMDEGSAVLWTSAIDLCALYFVTSDLKDIDWLQGLAVLLQFYNEGYYTVYSLASEVCEAAKSNSQQIKISVTTLAQPREVDYGKLRMEYEK